MLASLPSDLSLYILSFLSLHDISQLYVLSRKTRHFLLNHESEIYHQLAVSHRFVASGNSLQDAVLSEAPSKWLDGVKTWKDIVRRWAILERNWSGRGSVLEGGYAASRDFALAMEDNRKLWNLPEVRHFEWSEGFLAFVNTEGSIEVWRRSTDVHFHRGKPISTPLLSPSPLAAVSSQFERAVDNTPAAHYEDGGVDGDVTPTYEQLRGQYTPHAFIASPYQQLVRWFRFRYPVVAFITHVEPYTIHLYDIAQGVHIRSVDIDQVRQSGSRSMPGNSFLMNTPPIDLRLSDSYVAACFDSGVIVLAIRAADETRFSPVIICENENSLALQQAVLQLRKVPRSELLRQRNHDFDSFADKDREQDSTNSVRAPGLFAMERFEVVPPTPEAKAAAAGALVIHGEETRISPCFASLEFSPDERRLVIVTGFGLLYLIPDFSRIARGLTTVEKIVQRVHIGTPLSHISWGDRSRRFALKTEEGDTFIIDLEPSYHSPSYPRRSSPVLQKALVHRLADFRMSNLNLVFIHMQLTRTRLWLVWDPQTLLHVVLANQGTRAMKGHLVTENEWREKDDDVTPLPKFNPRSYGTSVCFIDFTPDIQ
ncbi:unnamed protein product [Somion occarium]|uniref:F-box domain-containing protein n=1 Tax=Somion occarium TaxID=3059160 RepID=A0ABP1DUC3_9APHY